jgi:hypothetical protein
MQSQSVKREGVDHGVCNVIPDYQNEIAKLKEALAIKTTIYDLMEGKLACQTRLANQQCKYIDKLDKSQQLLVEQKQLLVSERELLLIQNTLMKEQLDLSQHLKQTLEKSQFIAEILSSALAEERAYKRQRREDGSHFVIQ